MDRNLDTSKEDESIELPPGFRFHPTDEELITHYLSPKVLDAQFWALAIGEVDMNKCEPWDLPIVHSSMFNLKARARMGEKEWYFFTIRDRKYPTGPRMNRATDSGYWKATGKDKEIYRMKKLVGMKKTLVFYRGRAPKGKKMDWVMHEYRLEGGLPTFDPPKSAKEEWVICRIFQKGAGDGTKTSISQIHQKLSPAVLPPLTDSSLRKNLIEAEDMRRHHVTCFSEPVDSPQRRLEEDTAIDDGTNSLSTDDRLLPSDSPFRDLTSRSKNHAQSQDSALFHDQSLVRLLLEDYGSTSGGAVDLDFLRKY